MLNPYGNIFVFLIVGFGVVFATMVVVKIIAPHRPNPEKLISYECGERPIGPGWINFNARFYLIAILFIIFDVELILVFPVIANFRDYLLTGNGLLAFIEIFLFIAILFLGLIFAWENKYLEWLWAIRKRLRVDTGVLRIKDVIEEKSGVEEE
ncbi:MAG: NADH-quinone oxidoreductase subunit A [Nitrospiraceae bacterium]|nr:MAG: NADH-quinone oxidoreductase subunit A [Nitrospiraceae bacterium]